MEQPSASGEEGERSGVSVREESRVVRGAVSSVPVPESLLLSRELPHDSDDHSGHTRSGNTGSSYKLSADVALSDSDAASAGRSAFA